MPNNTTQGQDISSNRSGPGAASSLTKDDDLPPQPRKKPTEKPVKRAIIDLTLSSEDDKEKDPVDNAISDSDSDIEIISSTIASSSNTTGGVPANTENIVDEYETSGEGPVTYMSQYEPPPEDDLEWIWIKDVEGIDDEELLGKYLDMYGQSHGGTIAERKARLIEHFQEQMRYFEERASEEGGGGALKRCVCRSRRRDGERHNAAQYETVVSPAASEIA